MTFVKLATLAFIFLAMIGCGGGGGEQASETPQAAGSVWLQLFKRIPLTPETTGWVEATDYALLRTVLDIDVPADTATPNDLATYRDAVLGIRDPEKAAPLYQGLTPRGIRAEWISGFDPKYFDPEAWDRDLGFDLSVVDQQIDAARPPDNYIVLSGRFDRAQVDSAIRSAVAFKEGLIVDNHSQVQFYSWGEDLGINIGRRTALLPIGQSFRIAVDGHYLTWTRSTKAMKQAIDAASGAELTLADDPVFRDLATIFGDGQIYTIVIGSGLGCSVGTLGDLLASEYGRATAAALTPESLLLPYAYAATGIGLDKSGPFGILVIVNRTVADAEVNMARISALLNEGESLLSGNSWSDVFQDVEVRVEGLNVIVNVRFLAPGSDEHPFLIDVFDQCDRLLLSQ